LLWSGVWPKKNETFKYFDVEKSISFDEVVLQKQPFFVEMREEVVIKASKVLEHPRKIFLISNLMVWVWIPSYSNVIYFCWSQLDQGMLCMIDYNLIRNKCNEHIFWSIRPLFDKFVHLGSLFEKLSCEKGIFLFRNFQKCFFIAIRCLKRVLIVIHKIFRREFNPKTCWKRCA